MESVEAVKIGMLGAFRSVLSNSLTHSLDVVKLTQQQANSPKNIFQTVRGIHGSNGVRGLFYGYTISILQGGVKEGFIWPAQILCTRSLKENSPDLNPIFRNATAGATSAAVDTIITTPLANARIEAVNQGKAWNGMWRYMRITPIKVHFNGASLLFAKGTLGWSSFLTIQELYKRKYTQVLKRESLTFSDLLLIAPSVTLTTTAINYPLDFLFTRNHTTPLSLKEKVTALLSPSDLRGMYKRGFAMAFLSRGIQNLFSMLMIHEFSESKQEAF
jgi:hypothetical protein